MRVGRVYSFNQHERKWNEAIQRGGKAVSVLSVLFLVVAMTIGVAPAAVAAEPLKVAAVFETPIEEPWVNQIHVALVKAKKEMGIVYDYSESVKSADFARVMREYAEKGYQLITGDSFGAERIARRVARDYPDVAFVFGSGIGPAEPNFGVFDNWIHEPAYLCGMIAGKMTKIQHHRRGGGHAHSRGQPALQRVLRRGQGGQQGREVQVLLHRFLF